MTTMTKALSVLAISLFFVACGQVSQNAAPSVDQNSVVVKVLQPGTNDCTAQREEGNVGGHGRRTFAFMEGANGPHNRGSINFNSILALECATPEISVTGHAENTSSVLVDVNGTSASATVDQNGNFNVVVKVADPNAVTVNVTPLEF